MGQRFYVITYRTGGKVYFFRGDQRYAIYLPKCPGPGWVEEVAFARIFVRPPDFDQDSIHGSLQGQDIHVCYYEQPISHTQVLRPTTRPLGYRKRYKQGLIIPPPPKKKR
jgi:hypothetical protein